MLENKVPVRGYLNKGSHRTGLLGEGEEIYIRLAAEEEVDKTTAGKGLLGVGVSSLLLCLQFKVY